MLLETDGREWGPMATAAAIATRSAVRELRGFDLLLFGNEAADTGGYQVPIRVAHALGLPVRTGIKQLDPHRRPGSRPAGSTGAYEETFDLPLPAVVSVKEGINLPRYPSLPGRLRAKRAAIESADAAVAARGAAQARGCGCPPQTRQRAEVLGSGADAVPALVALLDELGVLS